MEKQQYAIDYSLMYHCFSCYLWSTFVLRFMLEFCLVDLYMPEIIPFISLKIREWVDPNY